MPRGAARTQEDKNVTTTDLPQDTLPDTEDLATPADVTPSGNADPATPAATETASARTFESGETVFINRGKYRGQNGTVVFRADDGQYAVKLDSGTAIVVNATSVRAPGTVNAVQGFSVNEVIRAIRAADGLSMSADLAPEGVIRALVIALDDARPGFRAQFDQDETNA